MTLDEYVKQTIVDIAKGVSEAKREASVGVAPGYVDGEKVFSEQLISFEIVVSAEKEANGGLKVPAIGELSASAASNQSNKISFQVPIFFQGPPTK